MQTNATEAKNPYWDIVQSYPGDDVYQEIYGRWMPDWIKIMLKGGKSRNELCQEYAWAIPSPEALAFVAKHLAPNAIEIGAGTGYWASLLSQMGVSMLCFDANPPHISGKNDYHSPRESEYGKLSGETREVYFDVQQGDHTKATEYPDHTLFLCWPPYDSSMASDCLKAYTGNKLVYIGEGDGGCTADDSFFALLSAEWHEVETFTPIQWSGIHDYITVFERGPEEEATA